VVSGGKEGRAGPREPQNGRVHFTEQNVAGEGARKCTGTTVQTGSRGETGYGEGAEPSSISLHGTFPNSNRRNFSSPDTRVKPSTCQSPQLKQPSDETGTRSANTAYVMLANFSEETLTVPKHTVLGIAQQVSEELIDKINAEG